MCLIKVLPLVLKKYLARGILLSLYEGGVNGVLDLGLEVSDKPVGG